jgi:hypothetical protein
MKKLSILTIIALGSISLSATPVLARDYISYRYINSNSILECAAEKQQERHGWSLNNSGMGSGGSHT